jgi:hypothetical protein
VCDGKRGFGGATGDLVGVWATIKILYYTQKSKISTSIVAKARF